MTDAPKLPSGEPLPGGYEIGENIKRRRRELGISQKGLAEKMRERGRDSWHQNTVSRVELGRQDVVVYDDVLALQDILGSDLIEGTGWEPSDRVGAAATRLMIQTAHKDVQQAMERLERVEGVLANYERLLGEKADRDGPTS